MQAFDYALLYSPRGSPSTWARTAPRTTRWTGFHMAHVFGGVIMLVVVLYRGLGGQFARHHDAVEASSLYWHFVDAVWIVLLGSLPSWPWKRTLDRCILFDIRAMRPSSGSCSSSSG